MSLKYNEQDLQQQVARQLESQGFGGMNASDINVSMKPSSQGVKIRNLDGSEVQMDAATQAAIAQQTGMDDAQIRQGEQDYSSSNYGGSSGNQYQQQTAGRMAPQTQAAYDRSMPQQSTGPAVPPRSDLQQNNGYSGNNSSGYTGGQTASRDQGYQSNYNDKQQQPGKHHHHQQQQGSAASTQPNAYAEKQQYAQQATQAQNMERQKEGTMCNCNIM